jgi:hypothetical protein
MIHRSAKISDWGFLELFYQKGLNLVHKYVQIPRGILHWSNALSLRGCCVSLQARCFFASSVFLSPFVEILHREERMKAPALASVHISPGSGLSDVNCVYLVRQARRK